MKLWLLESEHRGYDRCISCVVTAETEEKAKQVSPAVEVMTKVKKYPNLKWCCDKCTYLGETELPGGLSVCSSWNWA